MFFCQGLSTAIENTFSQAKSAATTKWNGK